MSEKKKDSEPAFTKEQLVASADFRDQRDLVAAVLEDGKSYTKGQAEDLVDRFMKGKVK
jgi:spore coat polysaccharide biosynthesis protein SpsF (cytidylyltransferase family)